MSVVEYLLSVRFGVEYCVYYYSNFYNFRKEVWWFVLQQSYYFGFLEVGLNQKCIF